MRIGVVGTGTMGSAVVKRLVDAGEEVYAEDTAQAARENAARLGAKVVPTAAEIADSAELAFLSLPMPGDVEQVVTGEGGLLARRGSLKYIVDISTVDPFTSQRNAAAAERSGLGYLDAPVLGRPQACGNWTLPVGGRAETLEACRGPMARIAKSVVHVGPAGSGSIVKLLNNMVFGAINAATAEVFAICRASGLDPRVFYETVANSGAATVSGLFKESGSKIVTGNFEPMFTVDLLHKDMMLGIGMARRLGVPVLVSESNQNLNEMARLLKLGKEDTSSVIKVYQRLMGPGPTGSG